MGGRGRDSERYYLHEGKQGKHMEGDNNFIPGRSKITISKDELKKLFDKYKGTGEKQGNKEIVDFGKIIGQTKNPVSGKIESTSWGKIHYDINGGYHIVPFIPF